MTRELKISGVSIEDCTVKVFTSEGSGGKKTGVRVTHELSGATGESREERTQIKNKKNAYRRMTESPEFMNWLRSATR